MNTLALVIGNNTYPNNHSLVNAINDAQGIADTFKRLSYEVIDVYDIDKDEFDNVLFDFENKLDQFDNAIFYYAGHGFQVDGVNYLSSTDCDLDNIHRFNANTNCTKLDDILFIFKRAKTNVNIAIIDACRKFIDRGTSDSFTTVTAPKGSIIAFSTSPGEGAKDKGMEGHSIYTGTLLKFIGRELLSVESLFKKVRRSVFNFTDGKQTSWEHTSLINEFYFNTGQLVHSLDIPYDESVVKDKKYQIKDTQIDQIISDLKSCDWNKQNPAMDKLNIIPISKFSKDELFILGRNILQASGHAYNATNFIKDLSNNLLKYQTEDENHLLNGILFEVYFNNNREFRRGKFKGNYMEHIFALRSNKLFKKSFEFINKILQQHSDELFYIPSSTDIIIDVDVSAYNKDIESFSGIIVKYQIIKSIVIDGKDVTSKMASICQIGLNLDYLKQSISNFYLIPKDIINVINNIPIEKMAFEKNL